jgi:hypothetical protein
VHQRPANGSAPETITGYSNTPIMFQGSYADLQESQIYTAGPNPGIPGCPTSPDACEVLGDNQRAGSA